MKAPHYSDETQNCGLLSSTTKKFGLKSQIREFGKNGLSRECMELMKNLEFSNARRCFNGYA